MEQRDRDLDPDIIDTDIIDTDISGQRRSATTTRLRPVERAASLVEYGLLIALIALAAVVAMQQLGQAGADSFGESESRISVASS